MIKLQKRRKKGKGTKKMGKKYEEKIQSFSHDLIGGAC